MIGYVGLMGTRVLKAHVDAVIDALPAAKIALRVTEDVKAFAQVIAEAVVTADSKTRYVIYGRTANRAHVMIFGPYLTHAAALKALNMPLPDQMIALSIHPIHKHPIPKGK